MTRTFSAAILALCSVLFLSGAANAACYDKTCADMGYTLAAGDCDAEGGMVKCPFDLSKVFCQKKSNLCAVGDIYYSDGSCSKNIVSGKTPVGVVGYITYGGEHGGIIALEEKTLQWSGAYQDVSCLANLSTLNDAKTELIGFQNTQCIISQTNTTYPAAQYCNKFKPVPSGIGSQNWYLPAAGELFMVSSKYESVNDSLQRLSKTQLSRDYYWSSSEYNYSSLWRINLITGSIGSDHNKDNEKLVRCMLEF